METGDHQPAAAAATALPELPDCHYQTKPILIRPAGNSPNSVVLYLSNLDDHKFIRFAIKYVYLYKRAVPAETLRSSLSMLLSYYYPLAGRLRACSSSDDRKLEVVCNGEGALFVEAFMDCSADEFLKVADKPNCSWRKLLYKVDGDNFLDVPPLVIQATYLRCGGMILCTAINHCLCDGIGASQLLNAWAYLTTIKPDHQTEPTIKPFHSRHVLKPRSPPLTTFTHPAFALPHDDHGHTLEPFDVYKFLQSQGPLVPTSITFTPSQILDKKKQCCSPPWLQYCTSFEALASHTWRCWVRSLGLPRTLNVKLIFPVNVRKALDPNLPQGYYGNGFVLACAETAVEELLAEKGNCHGVRSVRRAKASVKDEHCVRSMVDLLESRRMRVDLETSLVISQWSRLGLEDVDFGAGKPLHIGPLASQVYCLFLPVAGEPDSVRVLVSMPENVVAKFEFYMMDVHGGHVLIN